MFNSALTAASAAMTSTSCHRVFVEKLLLVNQDVVVNGEDQKDSAPTLFIHHSNMMTLRRVLTAGSLATACHLRQQLATFGHNPSAFQCFATLCNTFCQKLGLAFLNLVCIFLSF